MRFGIIAAIEAEARVFRRRQGTLFADDEFRLCVAGPGAANAARAAAAMLEQGCGALVSWGVAGALAPQLRAGDVIVSARTMDAAGAQQDLDAALARSTRATIGSAARVLEGVLLSATASVASARDKQALHKRCGAAAVDLESGAIATVAAAAACRFVAVRAIVDEAAFDLPPAALLGLADDGRLDLRATLRSVLTQPTQLPQLIRLAGSFRTALAALGHVARRLAH